VGDWQLRSSRRERASGCDPTTYQAGLSAMPLSKSTLSHTLRRHKWNREPCYRATEDKLSELMCFVCFHKILGNILLGYCVCENAHNTPLICKVLNRVLVHFVPRNCSAVIHYKKFLELCNSLPFLQSTVKVGQQLFLGHILPW